jgi:hypothetical protein
VPSRCPMGAVVTADNATQEEAAPSPDDPGKADSPTDLTKRSALYVVRKTVREFSKDQCADLAAALTYYAVLSIFPALVVIVSLLGVFGQGKRTTDSVLQIVGDLAPGSAADTLRAPIEQLVESPSAGFALIAGIVGALWSASGYIGAFGTAMNRIYESTTVDNANFKLGSPPSASCSCRPGMTAWPRRTRLRMKRMLSVGARCDTPAGKTTSPARSDATRW